VPIGALRTRDNLNAYSNAIVPAGNVQVSLRGHDGLYTNGSFNDAVCIRNQNIPDFHHFDDYVHNWYPGTHRYPVDSCTHLSTRIPVLPPLYGFDLGCNSLFDHIEFTTPGLLCPISVLALRYISFQVAPGGSSIWSTFAVPNQTVADLSLEAFNYFTTVWPTELSSSEFAQGFFQLQDLLPTIGDSIQSTLAGGFLTKEFGWDNLLSDLNTLSGLLDDVHQRIEYLKRTYGIPTRLGFHRPNILDKTNLFGDTFFEEGIEWPGFLSSRVSLKSFSVDFRATAWITQRLDFIDGIIGWLRAIAGALGLDNPVLLFWQTLPFSFVVDWFLNVSDHLTNLTRMRPAIGWDVSDITRSMHYKWEWDNAVVLEGGTSCEREASHITLQCDAYSRDIDLPLDLGLLDLANLSQHQQLLLLALGLV